MESALEYLIGIVVVVIGIALSVGLHEAGHMVPAKLFGVKVTQYMIGFGKTLWSRKIGETEYGIKAIPLGGYCAMIGMYPPEAADGPTPPTRGFFKKLIRDARRSSAETIPPGEEYRSFYLLPVWKRIVVMAGGILMNLLLAVVFYAILLCAVGTPQLTTTLSSVSECVLPATSQRQACETGDQRSPGAEAGLKPGDTILSIDGTTLHQWDDLTAIVQRSANEPLSMVVDRGGHRLTVQVTPTLAQRYRYDASGQVKKSPDGTALTENVGFIGIGPTSEYQTQPITAVLPAVGNNVSQVAGLVVTLPQRMVTIVESTLSSKARSIDDPVSIVGVGRIAGEIAASSSFTVHSKIATMVGLMAGLNIALFVFNLIPLMPLDGGQVAGAIWEAIRRALARVLRKPDPGPFDAAKLMPLTVAVFGILIIMSGVLIIADLVNPIRITG